MDKELETRTHSLEESLRQHIRRLQVLHDIDQAILSAQGEEATAKVALKHIPYLVPNYRASSVLLIDLSAAGARLLAIDIAEGDVENISVDQLPLDALAIGLGADASAIDLEALKNGRVFLIDDLCSLQDPGALQKRMLDAGICSYLSVALRYGDELLGALNLASDAPFVFEPEHVQIAQEVADSLAVALQQARLRQADQRQRQEAEIMRDVMASLAGAVNLKQALEIILVNLHNVIQYDRAGLFLADENGYVLAEKGLPSGEESRTYLEADKLVSDLQSALRPIVVQDVQADPRFASWPDMQTVRGWLGAPLVVGEEMIGFLALGSLEEGAFDSLNAETMQVFASQVSEILEKAWRFEQSHRRTQELEVLSNFTFALGQAEDRENTLYAIIDQVTEFFGAVRGTFLFPDKDETALTIKFSLDETLVGMTHPRGNDLIWEVYDNGQPAAVSDTAEFMSDNPLEIYHALCKGVRSAAFVPLRSGDATYGILFFAFERQRLFVPEDVNLYDTVAEIAGTSLRRVVVLEALEEQVNVRTQHLSTLYNINSVASEPLEFHELLEQVLDITLRSLNSEIGGIHFLNEGGRELQLAAQRNLTLEMLPLLDGLSLEDPFWRDLVHSTNPVVIPDMLAEIRLPPGLQQVSASGKQAYIGAPIRAKGRPLGLLSLFGASIQDYTLEDITLFMTIADQVGSLVERARLTRQAEHAAVVEERQRLARELHDSVTQLLYSQVLFAGAGLKVLHQGDQELAEQHLKRIDQAALQALKEMRLLVYELRPSDQLDEGLITALSRRLDAVEKRTGIDVQLQVEGQVDLVDVELDLDEGTQMAVYRIVEEALNNALKHAEASTVKVQINTQQTDIRIEIIDDGHGFDLHAKQDGGGMGLVNMRERAAALGGGLEIITQPGEGTRVIVRIEGL